MTLRKITVDNSVRYIPKSEQTRESNPIMKKNQPISGGGKPNKKPSQNNKRVLKKISASRFTTLTN